MEQLADIGVRVAERSAGISDGKDGLPGCRERAEQKRFPLAQWS
jgi:hypothetical protein